MKLMQAKAHTGSLPATALFWSEGQKSRLLGKHLQESGDISPLPRSEPGGNQKLLTLNKTNVIGLILGGRTIFTGMFSSSAWQRAVCCGKNLENDRLPVGYCPSFIQSIFNTTTFFLRKIAGFQIGFFCDVLMVPHSPSRTSYLQSQESFSLGVWSQGHTVFGWTCQGSAFIFLSNSLPSIVAFPILAFACERYSGSFAGILHLRQLYNGIKRYKISFLA